MAAFGGGAFGGGSGGGGSVVPGVPLLNIMKRAYRIAGITKIVGTTLQDDWFLEALEEMNAMVGGLNCDRLNLFTTRIDAFDCQGFKAFLIGDGATAQTIDGVDYGAFDMPRPQKITTGVIVLGDPTTAGVVRMPPMYQMNDEEWAQVSLQDVPNGIPLAFYFDGGYSTNPDTLGLAKVFLWTQTTSSYFVEFYSWQSIPKFNSQADTFAMPDGYEDEFVYLLAERLAALNPHQQKMQPQSYRLARQAKQAIRKLNAPLPKLYVNDAANIGNTGRGAGGHFDYRTGNSSRFGWNG